MRRLPGVLFCDFFEITSASRIAALTSANNNKLLPIIIPMRTQQIAVVHTPTPTRNMAWPTL
jgi:hypothetical protein